MKTKRIFKGLAALVAGIGILGSGVLGDESNRRALVPLEPEQTQTKKVEENKRVYTLAPGNYEVWVEEEGENGMQCTPLGKVVIKRPVILVEDDSNGDAKKNSKDEVRYEMRIRSPDGSVHYNVKVFNKEGKFLKEYTEPSNERIERAQDSKGPRFYSTTPVFKYPDRSMDFYRPLGPDESLEDAMKRGPDQRFVPERKRCSRKRSIPPVGARYVYESKEPNGVNQYTDGIKPGDKVKRVESELGGPDGANLIHYLEKGK